MRLSGGLYVHGACAVVRYLCQLINSKLFLPTYAHSAVHPTPMHALQNTSSDHLAVKKNLLKNMHW
jgi:hypothetical protein